jgi:hypothetical protein
MEVEARPGSEPGTHFGMFVRGVVVDDEVDIEGRRDIGLDMLEKGEKLLVAMSCAKLREDSAIGKVQACEQGRRAMPDAIVGDTLNIVEPKRERRLRTIQSLNLALLITTSAEYVNLFVGRDDSCSVWGGSWDASDDLRNGRSPATR